MKGAATTTQDCRGVKPEIPSHIWEYPKHRVMPQTLGLPEISGNTEHFGYLPPDDFQN